MSNSDEADLKAAQRGDAHAFERLMREHEDALKSMVRHWVANDADAEDVFQQVLMCAWKRLPSLERPSSFRFWLATIARRYALRILRTRRKTEVQASDEAWLGFVARNPTRESSPKEIQAALSEALQSAKPAVRAAAMRHFLQGQSIRTIAGETKRPAGTIKRQLFEARALLKQYYKPQTSKQSKETQTMKHPKNFGVAIAKVRAQLKADGRSEYLPLLSRERVLAGIRRAALKYERDYLKSGKDYFERVIKKRIGEVLEAGAWPQEASLEYFFESKGALPCEGFSLGIEFSTPNEASRGFSLPVVEVRYGSWEEEV